MLRPVAVLGHAGTIIEVNVSELGLVTPGGKVVWGKYAQGEDRARAHSRREVLVCCKLRQCRAQGVVAGRPRAGIINSMLA